MTKTKEIITLILGVLFGTMFVLLGYFDAVNYYLITFGLAIALSAIGIELGVNLFPHNKAEVEGIKIDNEIKRLSLERRTNETPKNATIITASPTLKEAVKDLITAITPEEECEPCKEDETEEARFPIFRDPPQ